MLIDLHAKTSFSHDVTLSARQVLQAARDAGLDGIAFCETLSTAHCTDVLNLARSEFPELKVFIGVEIPTDRGIFLGFVPKIDSFYIAEEWRWLTHKTTPSAAAVIDLFDRHNGFAIAARPYDLEIPFNMGDYIFAFDQLGAVEVFTPRVGQIQSNFALEAATFMGLNTVGGSDPKGEDTTSIGQFATFFKDDIQTQSQFVDELRDSEYWAVQIGTAKTKKSSRRKSKSRQSQGGRRSQGRGKSSRNRNSRSRSRRSARK